MTPMSGDELKARRVAVRVRFEEARDRQSQLVQEWARARIRRTEIRSQRRRLRSDIIRRQSFASLGAPRAAAAVLEAAVHVSSMDLIDLWLDYVALGGNATPEELSAILAGNGPLKPLDHDRLAIVLNQWFSDAGYGRPISYWDGSR